MEAIIRKFIEGLRELWNISPLLLVVPTLVCYVLVLAPLVLFVFAICGIYLGPAGAIIIGSSSPLSYLFLMWPISGLILLAGAIFGLANEKTKERKIEKL